MDNFINLFFYTTLRKYPIDIIKLSINGDWYDYCAFDGTDIEGNATGGYTVILTKKEQQATAPAAVERRRLASKTGQDQRQL